MIADEEGCKKVIAWTAAKKEAEQALVGEKKQNDPDRPAA
jgi:hypothetical protein